MGGCPLSAWIALFNLSFNIGSAIWPSMTCPVSPSTLAPNSSGVWAGLPANISAQIKNGELDYEGELSLKDITRGIK